jgi:hypothetical protein
MKAIRLISLISRVALMITLVLGLVFWIGDLSGWVGLLNFVAQIGFPSIHEGFGTIGVLGLLILGGVALLTRGIRLLGASGVLYAFLVPAFGMTQTMILVDNLHWLIQAIHLLVGIGAMFLILRIVKSLQQRKV